MTVKPTQNTTFEEKELFLNHYQSLPIQNIFSNILQTIQSPENESQNTIKVSQKTIKEFFDIEEYLSTNYEIHEKTLIIEAEKNFVLTNLNVQDFFSFFSNSIKVKTFDYYLASIIFQKNKLYQSINYNNNSVEVIRGTYNEKFLSWGKAVCSCLESDYKPLLFVYSAEKKNLFRSKDLMNDENIEFAKVYLNNCLENKISSSLTSKNQIFSKRKYLTAKNITDLLIRNKYKNDIIDKEIDIESLIGLCEEHLKFEENPFFPHSSVQINAAVDKFSFFKEETEELGDSNKAIENLNLEKV